MRSVKRKTHFTKVLKYVNFELNGERYWKRTLKMPNRFLNIYCQNHVYGNKSIPPEASTSMRFYKCCINNLFN